MAVISYTQEGKIRLFRRSPLFWIISGITLIALLVLVIFFINNALVKITYHWEPEARQSEVAISSTSSDLPSTENPVNILPGGYAFIPRNTKNLTAESEHSETIKYIERLPFFALPNISLALHAQSKLTKLGSESQGCNLVVEDRAFTHSCGNTAVSELSQPDNSIWHLRELPNDGVSNIFSRYKDGFLSLAYTDMNTQPATLQYVKVGERMEVVSSTALPNDFTQPDSKDSVMLYTDNVDTESDHFIIGNLTTGAFLAYDSISDTPSSRFNRDENINPEFENTLCDLTAKQFACYYGQPSTLHDNIEEHQQYLDEDDGLSRQGTLEVRPIDNIDDALTHERRVSFGVDEIHQDSHGNIYTLNRSSLITWDVANNFNHGLVAGDITNATSAHDGIIYTKEEGVYSYDTIKKESHLRFRSDRLTLGGISSHGDNVIFNAFVNTEDNTGIRSIAQIYKLTETPLPASENRPENTLPFGNADDNIGSMDYNDDYIQVAVIPAFGVSGQAQGLRYDREATLARRDDILKKLQDLDAIGDREVRFFVYGTADNPQL